MTTIASGAMPASASPSPQRSNGVRYLRIVGDKEMTVQFLGRQSGDAGEQGGFGDTILDSTRLPSAPAIKTMQDVPA